MIKKKVKEKNKHLRKPAKKKKEKPLHDDDLMTWGRYKGSRLGDIDDGYWRWFLRQPWCGEHPKLVQYARIVEGDDDD